MLDEGTDAPTFVLPGVVDGAPRDVDLSEYVGNGILVLAFYPADFNPACEEDSCGLTELDLFTMQQDVDVFAISPDSVFSHRQFAEAYSLSLPLLSDSHGAVIEEYDVRLDSEQLLAERAVFVVDQEGVIQYAWATDDMDERPDVDEVRAAVSSIGGDSTAVGRYRVGHAHYIEGRRGFTSAMGSYEDRDWLIAQGDFERAMAEFQEAADQFQSAVRFAQADELGYGFERAQEKATALWQAAEWLAESASAYASGDGEEGDSLRRDAEAPLETARDVGEPPDPDDITLDPDPDPEDEAESAVPDDEGAQRGETRPDDDLDAPSDPADDESTDRPDADREGADEDVGAAVQEGEDGADDGAAVTTDTAAAATDSEGSDIDAAVQEVEEAVDGGEEETADGDASTEAGRSAGDDTDPLDGESVVDETVDETVADAAGEGDTSDEDVELDLTDPE